MTLSEIYDLINSGKYKEATDELKNLNNFYRSGDAKITDNEYDKLIETLKFADPDNELFNSGVIEEVNPDRKEKLQFPMFSLDKESEIQNIHRWLTNKGLPLSTLLVITAKYDGISILKNELKTLAWSRGDGVYGETMHEHYKKIGDSCKPIDVFTIGEMIIPKPIFSSRTFYRENGKPFKNARNMIAGLKNSDSISEDLKYAKHVRYGFASEDFTKNKSEQIEFICKNLTEIPYKIVKASELDLNDLNELFIEWGREYDIDGLVFDIEDKNIRKKLGRETNNNPAYARAFKNPEWAEAKETTILEIIGDVSKQGYLKPVARLDPIELDGVTVSNVTLNNYKFVKDNNLGVGSVVKVKRSGGVIPKIVSVVKPTGFKMPHFEGYDVKWNDNGVELIVEGTKDQEIKKNIAFFEILGAENVSEGIINQLYENGYDSIKSILSMNISDFEKLDKFGKRKAEIVYNSIKKSITNVNLSKLMHASNMFSGLGSKKLELVCHFETKPDVVDVMNIDGFSLISANYFIDGYDKFYEWLNTVPQITIESKEAKKINLVGDDLINMAVVFTGVRRPDLMSIIESRGGKELSPISKNTTHLICKDKNSSSSKMKKASDLEVTIWDVQDLENFLGV